MKFIFNKQKGSTSFVLKKLLQYTEVHCFFPFSQNLGL